MRHVLRLASSRSPTSFLKPTSPLNPPEYSFISRLASTNRDQVLENSEAKQVRSLLSTKVTDIAALGQETPAVPHILPLKPPHSVEKSPGHLTSPKRAPNLDPRSKHTAKHSPTDNLAVRRIKSSKVKQEENQKKWQILNPAFGPEHFKQRSPTSDNRMLTYIQFITTPTSDTPGTALMLHFDDKRYIIGNAHEGLQRASLHLGTRFFKAKDFFLTGRTEWQSNGGLLGMILTLADASISSALSKAETVRLKREHRMSREWKGDQRTPTNDERPGTSPSQATSTPAKNDSAVEDPTVRLHGGPNLTHTLATARSFIFRKGMPIKVFEHVGEKKVMEHGEQDWEPTWSDSRVHVWAMPIKPVGVSEVNEAPKPESPRKRNLGEFMTGERPSKAEILNQWFAQSIPPEGQDEENQKIREFAVSEMFSSAWSHDNLIEMPLRDVKTPAALFIRDPVTEDLTRYDGPTPDGTAPVPDINVLVRQPWPGALIDHLPSAKRSSIAMSYIIRNHKARGRFITAAAQARNVPPGPLWAALASGSSVQSSDGVTVTPEMVLGPDKEGSGVAVIDLPSTKYVHDLVQRPEWKAAKVMSGVVAIIWILGPGVVHDETLLKFIEGQPGVQHIISSPEHCPNYLAMTSAATMAIRHNQIDPSSYAIPVHNNSTSSTSSEESNAGKALPTALYDFCQPARRGLKIQLHPKFCITKEAIIPILNTALVMQETSRDVLNLSQAARKEISSPAAQEESLTQNLPSPDAEIICLGTGSAAPSQHRNVSATLLRVPGCGSYLMDCGESTLGQLKRMYTAPQLAELFQDLKLIWISHLHADHHLGLTSVVKAWYEEVHGKEEVTRRRPTITEQMIDPAKLMEDGKRLFIVGHELMVRWLEEYSSVEDFGFDQLVPLVSYPSNMRSIDATNLEWNGTNVGFDSSKDPKIKSAIRRATGLSNLVSCSVSHCWGAQAVSLTFPTGFKFSYSGDCRPSRAFADIGKHSTVLLHEATFDDDLKEEAIAKKHSTSSEAIGVGVAMGARRVILTHFSQRYQNVPSLSALDASKIKLEDTEDVDDPSAGMDQPDEDSIHPVEPQAAIDKILENLDENDSQAQSGPQTQTGASDPPSAFPANTLAQIIASNINPNPRPQLNDMKIAVAFDHMHVKVRDIMHLEKFTPALTQLYNETADGGKNHKKASKETFSDDENDVRKNEQVMKREMEAQAEKARKGQMKAARKKENREKWEKEKREADERRKKSREGAMEAPMEAPTEVVEVAEPVEEKLSAVQ